MNHPALDVRFSKSFPRLPSQISITSDGAYTAASFPNGVVILIGSDGGVLWEHDLGGRATSVGMTPTGEYVYVSTEDGLVIFDRSGGELRRIKEEVHNAVLSSDGKFAFLGAVDATKRVSTLSFYDATRKALLKRQPGAVVWKQKFDEPFHFFTGARDGSKVFLGFPRSILCIDAEQSVLLHHKVTSTVKGLAVLPDASVVFYSTFEGHVIGLQMDETQTFLAVLDEEIAAVDCDARGEWILAASKAKPLLFLVNRNKELAWRFALPKRPIHVRLADDASLFAVVCGNDELLVCNNYFVDPVNRVKRALDLVNDPDYSNLSLNALVRSSAKGLTALVNAIKDGTVAENSYKVIGRFSDDLLSDLIRAVALDKSPDRLFRCLAAFYSRALPFFLRSLREHSETERREFYGRLAAAAAHAQDARLYDLLGLIHLRLGELEPAAKCFFEAVRMPDCPETATDHLKEALESLKRSKLTESVDQLFKTFI
ncbi:MAG: hypothetical protein JW759_07045 [Candidatus Coatesbacteria bacterium]|nr:hypothetical protein [Candidatus Coatesbacteria bacterium]